MATPAISPKPSHGSSWLPKQFLLVFLGSWLIYLACLPPGIESIDGYSMLDVAHSLVTKHNFTVTEGAGLPGRNGQIFSAWYPLQSLLAVPVVALAVRASNGLHLPIHYVESFAVTFLPALYTALTVGLVYLLSLSLGAVEAGAWLAAVTYGFGTIALVYTRDFYADPLLALLVALGFLSVFRTEPSWLALPISALAVLAKPAGIFLGPVLSLYLIWRTRRFWFSLLPGLGTAAGLGLYLLYNFYRFDNSLEFGQRWGGFSIRFMPTGLTGLLISPGRGLLWFSPCVILAILALWRRKTHKLEAWSLAVFAAAFLLFHSFWFAWHGGSSWGPRLLLPILPGLVALAGTLEKRGRQALAILATVTFLLTVPNLPSSYKRYVAELNEQGVAETEMLWRPSLSPLLHAWPAAIRQINDARHSDVRAILRERADNPAQTIATSRARRIVSFWWWVLPIVRISRFWGILLSALLAIAGISLLQLARSRANATGHAGQIVTDFDLMPGEAARA
jgi:hypothetical protein